MTEDIDHWDNRDRKPNNNECEFDEAIENFVEDSHQIFYRSNKKINSEYQYSRFGLKIRLTRLI
jgi:hypothetical protein